ncbi:hypothetical protein EIP91_011655 [Steccherinum ochraceum]|uniref:Uncharacterized protein n=1 Tax=Steccherinum ochraceum TaxID=92696 RepID=A0A4R0RKC8_9APHY|nr:hypothetical protein EIP91_011655 [Steccherinum ochraceum]
MILPKLDGFVTEWLMKRAGDTSDVPAPEQPPSNNQSNLPKIGGTFGGFIALVVCLATIVIFACIAIFILLYRFKPDRHERDYRKSMFGKRESSIYEAPLGPQGMRAKFKNFFGRGKKGEGWMRANNDDEEWDASDRNLVPNRSRGAAETYSAQVGPSSSPTRLSHPSRSSTSESIELSVPSDPHSTPAGPTTSYPDPFASPPLPNASPTSDRDQEHVTRDEGRFSVQSGDNGTIRSMRKFDGGTKFKEAIDFQ